jgi:hypothetical protein
MVNKIGSLLEDRNLQGDEQEVARPDGPARLAAALGNKAPSSPAPTGRTVTPLTEAEAEAMYAADPNWFKQAIAALSSKDA